MDSFSWLATARDAVILLGGLLNCILLIALIILLVYILRLVSFLRSELVPIVWTAKKTATSVEGTVDFATTTAITPLIRAVSLLFAISRFFGVLFGRSSARGERVP